MFKGALYSFGEEIVNSEFLSSSINDLVVQTHLCLLYNFFVLFAENLKSPVTTPQLSNVHLH